MLLGSFPPAVREAFLAREEPVTEPDDDSTDNKPPREGADRFPDAFAKPQVLRTFTVDVQDAWSQP